jgi:2-keto-3-deoxy-L-rhamnonate aldolase RhmA
MERNLVFERNRVLKMLEARQLPLGIQCFTGDTALIEVIGSTGFDFIMLDAEHSGSNPRKMEDLVRASVLAGLAAYVRVPDPRVATDIRRALEAGAEGVFLPEIRSVADIDAAAEAAFFPPKGDRGICPSVRAADYNFATFVDYTEWNNREVQLVPMIENPDGVAIIDDICAHPDVHMVIFGQGDLAFSLGEGTAMVGGEKTSDAYRRILASARRHGVAVVGGPVLTPTAAGCRQALEDGVTVFCLGLDSMGFRAWCETTVQALADGVSGSAEWSRPSVPASGFPAPSPTAR